MEDSTPAVDRRKHEPCAICERVGEERVRRESAERVKAERDAALAARQFFKTERDDWREEIVRLRREEVEPLREALVTIAAIAKSLPANAQEIAVEALARVPR